MLHLQKRIHLEVPGVVKCKVGPVFIDYDVQLRTDNGEMRVGVSLTRVLLEDSQFVSWGRGAAALEMPECVRVMHREYSSAAAAAGTMVEQPQNYALDGAMVARLQDTAREKEQRKQDKARARQQAKDARAEQRRVARQQKAELKRRAAADKARAREQKQRASQQAKQGTKQRGTPSNGCKRQAASGTAVERFSKSRKRGKGASAGRVAL